MLELLMILVLVSCQTAAEDTSQCLNLRGHYEKCGPRQFCANANSLDRGCRNCTQIYEPWCSDENIDTFKQKYPSCAVLCTEKKVADLNQQNERLRQTLEKTEDRINQLQVTKVVLLILIGIMAALTLFLIYVLFVCYCRKNREQHELLQPASTAALESDNWWCCCSRNGCARQNQRRPVEVVDQNPDSSQEETVRLTALNPSTPGIYPSTTPRLSDSGRESQSNISNISNISNPTNSSSSLSDAQAPTGGY